MVAANGAGVFKSADAGATWSAINNGITAVGGSYFQFSGTALVFDPLQTNHLLLKTDLGEFKTTDGGATWSPYSFQYFTLAFDPNNKGIIYANSAMGDGASLFKSTDDGVTWNLVSPIPGITTIFGLLVDPFNSSTLYAAASPGVFKSTDGGLTPGVR